MKGFYVYSVYRDDILVYVGKGQGDRYLHVNSGKSHNADLNRMHFEHVLLGKPPLVVRKQYCYSEQEAMILEHQLIFTHKPCCNTQLVHKEPENFNYGEDIIKGDIDWRDSILGEF